MRPYWSQFRALFQQTVLFGRIESTAGFLLRAGNRLFLPAVQVNVTGCFTEIFTEIIQGMFVCSKVKLHFVYGKILLSPSNQSCEDIWHMLLFRKYTICRPSNSHAFCVRHTHLIYFSRPHA